MLVAYNFDVSCRADYRGISGYSGINKNKISTNIFYFLEVHGRYVAGNE